MMWIVTGEALLLLLVVALTACPRCDLLQVCAQEEEEGLHGVHKRLRRDKHPKNKRGFALQDEVLQAAKRVCAQKGRRS
jgi:hypothetical protein